MNLHQETGIDCCTVNTCWNISSWTFVLIVEKRPRKKIDMKRLNIFCDFVDSVSLPLLNQILWSSVQSRVGKCPAADRQCSNWQVKYQFWCRFLFDSLLKPQELENLYSRLLCFWPWVDHKHRHINCFLTAMSSDGITTASIHEQNFLDAISI